VVNEAGRSAAELVSENGQAELANFISEYKANSNSRNMLRSTTLDSVEYDAEVDRIYDAKASLHAAVEEGDMDTMKLLLKRGVDTNSRGANYETPLE
jgi:ankyrin repeat protein